ncbi:MAG: acetyl-CoA carboxylase biotin carboxylase subunit [Elusimicrobia bacterium]|nr:acetyl-CoA carboxylase biotin carboxylase subunit [Elusimicrobiota bacterium]MBI5882157.1 acetyl-CoA carboxylase biotin carboxylase subunit [Elusimicrobiota bacterium]
MFKKILIANRSEIAVRVIRACREMGIKSVAVYSEADRESLHVRLADEAVCIGPAPAASSYLDVEAVLGAAKVTGAEAVHPGYGFLAENAGFCQACRDAGLVFIGPKPEAIRRLGFKSSARDLARKAGVPIVPGSMGLLGHDFMAEASKVGFPVMVKAAAGGGGKGLRLVREAKDLEAQIRMAKAEAGAAFKDDSVYLEKFIEHPRHVEIQIAADEAGGIVAFPERDCTVQRRHQKLIEESPSPVVTSDIRRRMQEAARSLAKAAGYTNVGTVEFLLDTDGSFYFMEVNTRLQVEHPVTELVTGLDLVNLQIRLAAGEKMPFGQDRASEIRAHSIEHRINAEDPAHGFAPCPGTIERVSLPGGPGVRVDTHIYPGYTVPSYYDSLIAKLIISAPDRDGAVARGLRAFGEFSIDGIKTTIPFHCSVLAHPLFKGGKFDTSFIEAMKAPGGEPFREPVKEGQPA